MYDPMESPFLDTPEQITWLVSMEPYVVELRPTAGLTKKIIPPVLYPEHDPDVATHAVEYWDASGKLGHRSVIPKIIKTP